MVMQKVNTHVQIHVHQVGLLIQQEYVVMVVQTVNNLYIIHNVLLHVHQLKIIHQYSTTISMMMNIKYV